MVAVAASVRAPRVARMSAPTGARTAEQAAGRWGRVPLSRRSRIVVAIAALATAVVAAVATMVLLGSSRPLYTASATVALVPAPGLTADQQSNAWKDITNGRATSVAVVVLRQTQWLTAAAQAAGTTPDRIEVDVAPGTASATGLNTALIDIGASAPSPSGAEAAVASIIQQAGPAINTTAGGYAVQVADSPDGTAVPTPKPRNEILIIVLLAGAGVGGGLAWTRMRRREAQARAAA
ncbi:hypothetical protein GCM10023403_04000 [Pseudonocardia benzenivorans]|nr:hypothetical protein PSD17_01890 [Pseudonocardia sp. D17]